MLLCRAVHKHMSHGNRNEETKSENTSRGSAKNDYVVVGQNRDAEGGAEHQPYDIRPIANQMVFFAVHVTGDGGPLWDDGDGSPQTRCTELNR